MRGFLPSIAKYGALGVLVGAVLAGAVLIVFGDMLAFQRGKDELFSAAAVASSAAAVSRTKDCTVYKEIATIHGDSMAGILVGGGRVTVLENYYACHAAARGDIVDYDYGGAEDLVKRVMGVPGDMLALTKSGSGWHILVNGAPLTNAQGETYLVSDAADRMLSLYVGDAGSIIPDDAYLVLGNNPQGSIDSTWFGLVGIGDLKGKVDFAGR